jgi:hypothetical protein
MILIVLAVTFGVMVVYKMHIIVRVVMNTIVTLAVVVMVQSS